MANITLTDRISVRVTAKNETEASDQKKRDGGNVASALGATGLTDSEKEEIGEDLGETVTGEDGKTYAKSSGVAAAVSKLYQKGEFDDPEYDDYVHNGYHYLRTNTVTCISSERRGQISVNGKYETHTFVEVNEFSASGGMFSTMSMSQEGGNAGMAFGTMIAVDPNALIHWKKYQQCRDIDYIKVLSDYDEDNSYTPKNGIMAHTSLTPNAYGLQTGVLNRSVVNAMLNGNPTITHHGGSKIDPTGKTDKQIKQDIEEAAAANNAIAHFSQNPTDTYVAVTDEHGNAMYFLGT